MAGSAVVGLLKVLLTADTAEFDSAMKRVNSSANAWAKDLGSIGRQATAVGSALTKTLTLPIVGLGVAAIKTGTEFESVMNAIQGVLTPTAAEMEKVRATAIRMGADTIFSASDAATAMLELGKAGFTTAQAIESVPQVLELAAASGLSMGEAAELAARALNAFGLETSDLSHVNDVLAKAVNSSSLQIGDLQTAFKYVGPIAQGFGVSIEQASAALAIMRDNGIAAETSGRALREALSRLANPVKAVHEVLGELGIDLKQVDPAMNSLSSVIGTLEGKGLTAAQSLKLFGDAAGPGMFALVNQGQAALVGLTTELENSEGAAKKMSDAMMQGLPGAMERLRGSVETAMLSISKAIEPAVLSILRLAERLADFITNTLVPAFTALPHSVQMVALGFTAMVAAAGPVIYVLGQLISTSATVISMFTAKGIAARALTALMPGLATGIGSVSLAAKGLFAALGPLALAITAVWAAWKIGNTETVKNAFAQWTLSSNTGYAAALRLVLGIEQMTLAEAKAATAATGAAESVKEQAGALDLAAESFKHLKNEMSGANAAKGVQDLTNALKEITAEGKLNEDAIKRIAQQALQLKVAGGQLTPELAAVVKQFQRLKGSGEDSEETLKKNKKAAEEFAKSLKDLGGATAIAGAQEVVKQLHAMDGPLNVLPDKLKQMADRLKEGAQAALMMGNVKLAEQYMLLAKTLDPIIQFQQRYNVTIGEYVTQAGMAARATEALWEQFYRLAGMTQTIEPLLKSTLDLDKLWVGLKVPVKSAMEAGQTLGDALKEGLSKSLSNLPNLLMQAFTGGGGIAGALKALAVQIGTEFGKVMAAEISKAIGSKGAIDWGNVLGSLPLAGMTIAIELALAAPEDVKNWVGVMDVLAKLEKQYGSVEAAEKALGKTFKEIIKLGREAALAFIHEALTHENAIAEVQQQIVDLQGELGTANSALDGLLSNAASLGYNFDREGNLVSVSFDKMKGSAEKFGVDVGSLGPKFKGQQLAATAKDIVDAFELMAKGGADVGGILFGMQDEISDLVNAAKKSGVELPAQMEPWIRELLRAGLLVDDNGEKLTDLTGIKFGAPVESEFDKVSRAIGETVLAIKELMLKIDDLIAKIAGIPDKTVKINYETTGTPPGEPPVVGDPGEGESGPLTPSRPSRPLSGLGNLVGAFPAEALSSAMDAARSLSNFDPSSGLAASPAFAGSAAASGNASTVHNYFSFEIHAIDGADVEQVTRSKIMPQIRRDLSNNTGGARTGFKNDLGI